MINQSKGEVLVFFLFLVLIAFVIVFMLLARPGGSIENAETFINFALVVFNIILTSGAVYFNYSRHNKQ